MFVRFMPLVPVLIGLLGLIGPSPASARWFSKRRAPVARDRTLSWLLQKPIAHRGLHRAGLRENSLPAFRAAIKRGLPIELDVRLLADGQVAVFHSEMLKQKNGRSVKLKRLTRGELGSGSSRIPLLHEVLDLVGGKVPLLIDIKNKGRAGPLEREVSRQLHSYRGKAAVIAYNPLSLAWFRRHAPELPRGQISSKYFDQEDMPRWGRFILPRLLLTPLSRPDFIVYDLHQLPFWPVSAARRLGKPVIGFTVRDRAEHQRARHLVDNVIFEGVSEGALSR